MPITWLRIGTTDYYDDIMIIIIDDDGIILGEDRNDSYLKYKALFYYYFNIYYFGLKYYLDLSYSFHNNLWLILYTFSW